MSDRTICNHCQVRDMVDRANERGVKLILVVEESGDMKGWTSARYEDEPEPVSWFMRITPACACG